MIMRAPSTRSMPVCRRVARSKQAAGLCGGAVRRRLMVCSLPVCHQVSARSANWHTVPACQLATPVRAASGKLGARLPAAPLEEGAERQTEFQVK